MYKIGELSKLCDISVKALRFYDAEGLLTPDKIDRFTGYRYYSASKLGDCYRITALKELGFSLDEIKAQLNADGCSETINVLDEKIAELRSLIETSAERLEKIESIRKKLTKGEQKMFNIIIRPAGEIRAAILRKNFKSKQDALREAGRIAESLPKTLIGKRKILINYETEYKETDLDIAAGVELTGHLPKGSPYSEKTVSFGNMAVCLCCGESELEDACKAIITELEKTEYHVCGAYYELYHSDGTVELKVPVSERVKEPAFIREDERKPFVDDPEVRGKWKMLDILPTREHFVYGKPKCGQLAWLKELYFIDGGQPYWSVSGWTRGSLFTRGPEPDTVTEHRYTLENLDGHKLLFLEMSAGCRGNSGADEIWVYEKDGGRHYASREEFRKTDNIDEPFVKDERVLGRWKVRDFVRKKDAFDPLKQSWKIEDLFVLEARFNENGEYVSVTKSGTNSVTSVWTKGLILNRREKTASAYEIRVIDGTEYLFREWKSVDYSFGGRICWYVFTREDG